MTDPHRSIEMSCRPNNPVVLGCEQKYDCEANYGSGCQNAAEQAKNRKAKVAVENWRWDSTPLSRVEYRRNKALATEVLADISDLPRVNVPVDSVISFERPEKSTNKKQCKKGDEKLGRGAGPLSRFWSIHYRD
jgi:hypothetical protein